MKRRDFLQGLTLAAGGLLVPACAPAASPAAKNGAFWPDGARLVVSFSMQLEAGAQPASGADSPFPPIDPKYPDLPATKWYEYGFKEGVSRLLDVFDQHKVKVTSHMVGQAVDRHPALAKEIVQRGHEAAAHGQTWTPQFSMTPEEERAAYEANVKSIEAATGTRPVGFNAFWLRGTPHTLEILQDLGFLYHIDDVSRDEPFTVPVRGKPFVVVPYTLGTNDIVDFEGRHWSSDQFASELKREFDQLYAEAGQRRRMMSVSTHDRIAGRPAHANAVADFIAYAAKHPGVAFLRKDEIARFALASPLTPHET